MNQDDVAAVGPTVADRYDLVRRLGAGGNSEVWQAKDRISGGPVAVKLLHGGAGAAPARVRREISALRLLRLPGVVQLLDEGTDEGRAFLVMELVQGSPFPGEGAPRTWDGIADVTLRLLEVLARVHAAGVVHRDLKPANVLVSASRLPTVLDFGLAHGKRLGEGLTQEGVVIGTPVYMAREQLIGDPVTARTDLYAVGLMLYEVLSGELPHLSRDGRFHLGDRIGRPAPPLHAKVPDVPASVAAAIDMLLCSMPDERPRSAVEVLEMLRGETFIERIEPPLPRLDDGAPVHALIERVRAGRAVDLIGPRGSGRSRCVREAFEALEIEGRRVSWARTARQPFESLKGMIGPLDETPSLHLHELAAMVDEQLADALAHGLVVLADDVERLDPWSAAALARCRSSGAVVRAITGLLDPSSESEEETTVHLRLISETALQALFAGRERIFHLRSDAARMLWVRTQGLQAKIAHEVQAWVRAGLARWDGPRLAIDRDTLDRLEAGLRVATPWAFVDPASPSPQDLVLPAHLDELYEWLDLAWPNTHPELLAQVMGLPLWRVEAYLEVLIQGGAAQAFPDGRVELGAAVRVRDDRPPELQRAAHCAVAAALPEGADGRLLHLLSGEAETAAVACEAAALALRLAREGHLGRAIAALDEALRAVRRNPDAAVADEERLLATWVEIAVPTGRPQVKDRVLYEICRAGVKTVSLARIEDLVRASLAFNAGGARSLALLDALGPFAELSMERVRQGVRVQAARFCSIQREAEVLDDVVAWAQSTRDTLTIARASGWLGRLRYRQGRFEEAASLHAEAQIGETWTASSINARLNRASALLEAFRFPEAGEQAEVALQQSTACRHAFFEARAQWLARAVAYRSGEALLPDRELVHAVAELGVVDFEALVCLTEAAVAYRAGDYGCAAELAERSHRLWTSIGSIWSTLVVRALALAGGAEPSSPDEMELLGTCALECPIAGVGIQTLGLLTRTVGKVPVAWRDGAAALVEGIPRCFWAFRMDVLSVSEALASLGVLEERGHETPGG